MPGSAAGPGRRSQARAPSSTNFINGTTEARVAGSTVRTKPGSAVEVTATNSSAITAQAGSEAGAVGAGFGGGAAISFGAAAAGNEIGNTIRALVDGSTVEAGDAVTIHATSTSVIHSVAIGIAASVSGGVFVGISLSGAGSVTENAIANTVEAGVAGGSTVSSANGQAISIVAADSSDIGSFSGAVAVAVGAAIFSAGVAVGVSVATADIGNIVRAKIDDSKVSSAAGLTVDAHATGNIRSHGLAAVFAGGSLGGFGAGAAISTNSIHSTVEARILDADAAGGQEATGTFVKVTATDDADILANAVGFAGSVGIAAASIGFVDATNTITSATTAKIQNSKVTASAAGVEVLAASTGSIKSKPTAAAIAGGVVAAAGGGVLSKNSVTPNTTATISGGSLVNAATFVKVEAKDTSTIEATIVAVAAAGGLGAVAVGLAKAEDTIGGSVTGSTAGSTITASNGDIDVLATANQTVTTFAVAFAAAFGAIAAAGVAVLSDEKIQPNVTASVTGGTLTALGHFVNIHASFTGNSHPTTDAGAVSISLGGSGSVAFVNSDALISGTTSAFAAGGTINANGLDVDATDMNTVTSSATSASFSTSVSISGVVASATVDRTTQAYLGAGTLEHQRRAGDRPGHVDLGRHPRRRFGRGGRPGRARRCQARRQGRHDHAGLRRRRGATSDPAPSTSTHTRPTPSRRRASTSRSRCSQPAR